MATYRYRTLLHVTLLAAAVAFTLPAEAGKRDNSVKWASNQVPESLDAYFNNVRIGVILAHHIWDTLIYRDPKTNHTGLRSRPPGAGWTTRRWSSTCAKA